MIESKLTGNWLEKVKRVAGLAVHHEQEAAKYNAMLADLMDNKEVKIPAEMLGHVGEMKTPTNLVEKKKRKVKPKDLTQAKDNVLGALRTAKKSLSISEIDDQVPHSFKTLKRALKSLQLANKIKAERMTGYKNRPYTGWSLR